MTETLTPKNVDLSTVAAYKRAHKPGQLWRCIDHCNKDLIGSVRKVVNINTVDVITEFVNGPLANTSRPFYTAHPRAGEYTNPGPNRFRVEKDADIYFEYELVSI